MVHFVGAGPGGPDLITLRGAELLGRADCVVYAGSLVNPALLGLVRESVPVYNSAQMTLEQVLEVLEETHRRGEIPSASTPGTHASTGPSGSRWTLWTPGASPGM